MIPTYRTLADVLAVHPYYVSIDVEQVVSYDELKAIIGDTAPRLSRVSVVRVDGQIVGIIDPDSTPIPQ